MDLFRETPAKEVIFVLPKTSRAFKNEEHFIILDNEAEKQDKKVSILCSNPDTNKLAKKYKFDVLLANGGGEKPLITAVSQFDYGKDTEEIEEEKDLEPEGEYQVVTVSKINRGLEGIVKQGGVPLKIASDKERPVSLGVRRLRSEPTYPPLDEIKNVWKNQSERVPSESIWTGINNRTKKSFKNFPRRLVIGLGGASVILLGTIIYMSTGSAKIDITPHKQPLDTQLKVSASDKFSLVDAGLNKIPGQLFNVEKSANQTFPTTGEKDVAQKARGTITVFNEYGTTSQVLIATTRFQTPDGLIFRTLKGIVVPGTTVVGGKIIPGSIRVEVIADKAGQLYNVPASKFGIPAFNEKGDTVRYEKIYGKSDKAMKGGAIGKAKVVTDTDFNTAKQTLLDQVTKDVGDSLKTQTAGLKIINASAIKLKDPESTAKVDEAADSFMVSVNGSIKTVGFKEDDLRSLIKQYIDKTQNLTTIPEKLTISYTNVVFDETNNTLTFTVNVKGSSYAKVDADKIKIDLSGKNEQEIKNYFKGAVGVDSVRVVLSPFWVKRIPGDKQRTTLQVNY